MTPSATKPRPAREQLGLVKHKYGNEIDVYRILKREEDRTTVMVRNIPNKFKQKSLLDMINENHSGHYNYFYLPMDLKVSVTTV